MTRRGSARAWWCAAVAAAATAVAGPGPAAAQQGWQSQLDGWTIRAAANQRTCFSEAVYQDGMKFRIGLVGPEKKVVFIFSKQAWNNVRPGATYTIRFVFDGQKAWTGNTTGAELQGAPALVVDSVKEAFFTDFMNFNTIALQYNNQPLGSFSLRGSAAALAELRKCHEAVSLAANGGPSPAPAPTPSPVTGSPPPAAAARPDTISCTGPFARDADARALERAFGAANVKRQPGRAGQQEASTIVFPDDPARRIEVQWRQPAAERRPASVQLVDGSLWKVAVPGSDAVIGIGNSLEEVERANGRPFRLLPFGAEDGGLVTPVAWQGGRLSQLGAGCALYVQFKPGNTYVSSGATPVSASGELQSNSETVRYARPTIVRVELYLVPEIGEERVRRLQKLLE